MSSLKDTIKQAIKSNYPLIYIHSAEEQRILNILRNLSDNSSTLMPVYEWSCTFGLSESDNAYKNQYIEPAAAIEHILNSSDSGIYVFKDLSEMITDSKLLRTLKDAYYVLSEQDNKFIFIVSPVVKIPAVIVSHIHLIEAELPAVDELSELITITLKKYTEKTLPESLLSDLSFLLRGFTLEEARHILHRLFHNKQINKQKLMEEINCEKKSLTSQVNYLQYVPAIQSIAQIGGLKRLKNWILKRQELFSQKGIDSRQPVPKGLLIMGISGCGKSLTAKVIAKTWGVPLFRLNMSQIFSNISGNPEATFHQALNTIESISPAVLWIDEIENGLGFNSDVLSSQSRIFSYFLTWMQEKPPLIFVVATANHIDNLPAELIRKGRFDEVFFCDLPGKEDREEIFRIHLAENDADLKQFDMHHLVSITQGWNAAEIQQLVQSARIEKGKAQLLKTDDIVSQSKDMIPLSHTMKEQIKAIKDWAWDRATPASYGSGAQEFSLDSDDETSFELPESI